MRFPMHLFLALLAVLSLSLSGCKPMWTTQVQAEKSDRVSSSSALARTGILQDWTGQADFVDGTWTFQTIEP